MIHTAEDGIVGAPEDGTVCVADPINVCTELGIISVVVVAPVLVGELDDVECEDARGVDVDVNEQTPTTTVFSVAPGVGPELVTDGTDPLGQDGK